MGLKDGTLKDLLLDPHLAQVPDRDERVAKLVIRHMLQTLDFLSVHGIVHRDVTPENILYTRTSGVNEDECLFQLGDFGLSNRQSVAKSVAGTEIYMAPEVKRGWAKQTSKADVWTLFVTVLWVLNANFVSSPRRIVLSTNESWWPFRPPLLWTGSKRSGRWQGSTPKHVRRRHTSTFGFRGTGAYNYPDSSVRP